MNFLSPILMQPWVERLGWSLVHFLWQGSVIAALYALVRTLRGRNGTAGFRHALACAALFAMVVAPIVTFIVSGSPESPRPEGRISGAIVSFGAFGGYSGVDWLVPVTAGALRIWRYRTASWIALAWSIGVIAFCARLAGGCVLASRIRCSTLPVPEEWARSFATLRQRLHIPPRVRLVVAPSVTVPVVVGWLRPIVLAPLYAFAGMERPLIEALFAHELAHILRRDYLVNLLQGVVEAVLFYHPAVWWISGHIRLERECCCDDIAATACGDTLVYVRALTELEAFRLPPPHPALAASGGSLTERIARLLGMKGIPTTSSRMVSAGPVVAIAAVLLAVLLATTARGYSQISVVPAATLPAFEVASIRPSDPDSQLKIEFAAGGRLIVTHATLRFIIKIAYDIYDDQHTGGPSWIGDKRFDVQAMPAAASGGDPQTMTKEQILVFHEPIRLRLQRLLADRFQLGLRKDSKPMPVFALIVAAKGAKLKTDSSPGDMEMKTGSGRGVLTATRADMQALAHFLSEGQVGRPVEDMTGITGKVDFRLEWTPDPALNPLSSNGAANPQTAPDSGGVSIFTALQNQLGLKLDPRTSPSDYLVVTRAELPSEN